MDPKSTKNSEPKTTLKAKNKKNSSTIESEQPKNTKKYTSTIDPKKKFPIPTRKTTTLPKSTKLIEKPIQKTTINRKVKTHKDIPKEWNNFYLDKDHEDYELFSNYEMDDRIMKGFSCMTKNQKVVLHDALKLHTGTLNLSMGYGKTLISLVLALMLSKINKRDHILFIMSKSLLGSCAYEIEKFFGDDLDYEILHHEKMKLENWTLTKTITITSTTILTKSFKLYDIKNKFVHFDTEAENAFGRKLVYEQVNQPLLQSNIGLSILYAIKWSSIVIDESQNYYNVSCDKCLSICGLSAYHRWLLSGTVFKEPKINLLFGYYLLLNDNSIPRNFPDFEKFVKTDIYPGVQHTVIRRDKNDDFKLPKIRYHYVNNEMKKEELLVYTSTKTIIQKLKHENDNHIKLFGTGIANFSSYVLAMISHLRNCILSPHIPIVSVMLKVADQDKKDELASTFQTEMQRLNLYEWLEDLNSVRSSRIDSVIQTMKLIDERIIIFSCSRKFLNMLRHYIHLELGREVFTIDGDSSIKKKMENQKNFRESNNGILLLTYNVGSEGLNMQECKTMFIVDYWWNASTTDQSISRIARPGQNSDFVDIYFFTSNTGIENVMLDNQISKINACNEMHTGKMKTSVKTIRVDDIIKILNKEDNELLIRKCYHKEIQDKV